MKKSIYIIRHGQTEYNKKGVVQGSGIDSDLNETGHAQATAFYEAYGHLPFDKIYTSRLKRTAQSVQKFLDAGHANEAHEGLNEVSWGLKEGLPINNEEQNYYNWLTTQWQNGHTHLAPEGGESPNNVRKRIQKTLDVIVERQEEKLVLIAMHGRSLRILLTTVLDQSVSQMDDYPHQNLCLYELEYDYDSKKYSLVRANDISHLKTFTI